MIGLYLYCVISALIPTISLALLLFCRKTKHKKLFIAIGLAGVMIFAVDIIGMFYLSEFSVEGLEGEPAETYELLPINNAYLLEDKDYYIGYAKIDENTVKELRMKKEFEYLDVSERSLYKVEDCISHVDVYHVVGKRTMFGIDVGENIKVNYIYLSQPVNVITH